MADRGAQTLALWETEEFYGPVTALAFHGPLLLVGQGVTVRVYEWASGRLAARWRVSARNKVHGIAIGTSTAGQADAGRRRVLVWGSESFAFIATDALTAGGVAAEFAAHDWIIAGAWDQADRACLLTTHNQLLRLDDGCENVVSVVACDVRCILYSATIAVRGADVLVAAGTVFGSIVVWNAGDASVVHDLTGHEGSIFHVQVSADGRHAVSCSDDRSIRLWDLETGGCVAVGWGHLARIWELRFRGDDVVSVSEDCTARVWTRDGDRLRCTQVLEGHTGKNVWALGLGGGGAVAATGGGDGRVVLWDLDRQARAAGGHECWEFAEIAGQVGADCGAIKHYVALSMARSVFTTAGGYVLLYDGDRARWSAVLHDPRLSSYSQLQGWPGTDFACVGDRAGNVFVVDATGARPPLVVAAARPRKVTELVAVRHGDALYMLVQFANEASLAVHAVAATAAGFELRATHTLALPPTFPIASALVHSAGGVLFVGSRFGALAVYDLAGGPEPHCFRRVVSDDCMTSITRVADGPGAAELLVTSRSGSYGICSVEFGRGPPRLVRRHANKIPRGGIEGARVHNGHVLVWGFRSNLFFIWDETEQYEIMAEVCGGPHRHWQLVTDGDDYAFMYTKTLQVYRTRSVATAPFARGIVQNGTHGREVRAVAVSPHATAGYRLVATGSEDTCLRLSKLHASGELEMLCSLRKHVSGVQQVLWAPAGDVLFSSGAREELFAWNVAEAAGRWNIVPAAAAPPAAAVPDLRVMDFAVVPAGAGRFVVPAVYSDSTVRVWVYDVAAASFGLAAAGRYKTCCIFKTGLAVVRGRVFVLAGSSDGFVTCWDVTAALAGAVDVVAAGLCARAVVAVADLPPPLWSVAVHQSSIRAMLLLPGAVTAIVTGGDDNSIAYTTVALGDAAPAVVSRLPSAHASTVTDIAQLAPDVVVSCAVDQRLKRWALTPAGLVAVADQYTVVADTGCLDTFDFQGRRAVVAAGAGLAVALM
ncbi:uncharacterized protein V1510DRAFT_437474 [Dipodascopsis tothii]|uniref:uncharacterized protein n=1 Tax=Dipodascopsis tothii TaxID=44089 RepID=UPI0034CE7FAA